MHKRIFCHLRRWMKTKALFVLFIQGISFVLRKQMQNGIYSLSRGSERNKGRKNMPDSEAKRRAFICFKCIMYFFPLLLSPYFSFLNLPFRVKRMKRRKKEQPSFFFLLYKNFCECVYTWKKKRRKKRARNILQRTMSGKKEAASGVVKSVVLT